MDVEIFYIWKVKIADSKISRASFKPSTLPKFLGFIIVIIFINVTLIIIIVIITVITFIIIILLLHLLSILDSIGRGPDGQNIVVVNRYCEYI